MSVTNAVFGPVTAAVAGQIAPRGGAVEFPFEDAVAHYAMIFDSPQNNLLNPGLRVLDRIGANDGAMNTGIFLKGNGVTSTIRIPHVAAQNPPADMSAILWLSTLDSGTSTFFAKFDTNNDRSWRVQLAGNVMRVDLSSNGGGVQKQYSSIQVINDGVLRMLAFRWTNATQTLEFNIDGVLATVTKTTDNALTPSINATLADITIFSHLATDVPANVAAGDVYDAQVWHAALTDAEFLHAFDHPEELPSDAPGSTLNPAATSQGGDLMCHYKVIEAIGDANTSPVYDSSGNNYHGDNAGNATPWVTDGGFPAPQVINTSFSRMHLFDGVDDDVQMVDRSAPANLTYIVHAICTGAGTASGRFFQYGLPKFEKNNTTSFRFHLTGAVSNVFNLLDLNLDTEIHTFAITHDGTSEDTILYVDGAFRELANAGALNLNSNNVRFGSVAANFTPGITFQGAVFDVVLDATEIAEAGNASDLLNHSRTADLVGYWKNDSWLDLVGSNDGVVAGTPVSINLPSLSNDLTLDIAGLPVNRERFADFDNHPKSGFISVPDDVSYQNIFATGGGVSFWYFHIGTDSNTRILRKIGAGSVGGWDIRKQNTDQLAFVIRFSTTDAQFRSGNGTFIERGWHYVTVAYDGSNVANIPSWYISGLSVAGTITTVPVGTIDDDALEGLTISGQNNNTNNLNGNMDEIILQTSFPTLQDHIDFFDATKARYGVA